MNFVHRSAEPTLKKLLQQFPAVCLLGPRQCGKTTLAKMCLKDWKYIDLQKPSDFALVSEDPEAALSRWGRQVILDEAQLVPSLFPVLRSLIDEARGEVGRFALLGSASFQLIHNLSESLAGRVGFLDLTPFHFTEVKPMNALWLRGGFPAVFREKDPDRRQHWFDSYTRTFIERDLNQLGIAVSGPQMRKLWRMLAHAHGGLWNASEFGASLGLSYHTVNRYTDILEQTFLIRKLPPYFKNIGKRLVKTPKVYFRDSGLLHYFLGISDEETLETHPKRGWSWEGFVIEQLIASLKSAAPGIEFFFWRTSTQSEVDLLLSRGSKIVPIEIKLHSAPKSSDVPGLWNCLKDLHLKKGYVVRPRGERYSLGHGVEVFSLEELIPELLNRVL